jgi:hypothetical protein
MFYFVKRCVGEAKKITPILNGAKNMSFFLDVVSILQVLYWQGF